MGNIESDNDENEFDKGDKFGSVCQKDLDKITGGMQTVKEFMIDLNSLDKLVTAQGDGKPSQGSLKFIKE